MKKGFTLIELLVCIVIVGVLSAMAIFQYEKAIWRVRSRELLISVKTLHEAQQRYYMIHDAYAEKFSSLDIDFSGYNSKDCPNFSMFPNSDCLSKDESVLFINNASNIATYSLFNKGKYKRSGFRYQEEKSNDNNLKQDIISCYDYGHNDFCTKIMKCEPHYVSGMNNHYLYPNL